MCQRVRLWLAERRTRVRCLLAAWQQRNPPAWVLALVGMAMGICLFLMILAWVGILRLVSYVVKSLR